MMVKLIVDYVEDYSIFLSNFEQVRKGQSDFDTVVINNTPSAWSGMNLISNKGFEMEVLSFIKVQAIILKINEKIDKNFNYQPKKFDVNSKKGILIAFQSMLNKKESKLYWQVRNGEEYHSIYVDNDAKDVVASFLHEFLLDQMNKNRNGLISQSNHVTSSFDLHDIGDENGNDLLYVAIKNNKPNAVESFLSNGFDPESNLSYPAIDAAWNRFISIKDNQQEKEEMEKILKLLLNANSRFPTSKNWFDIENIPKDVKDFLSKSEELHRLVDEGNFTKFKEDIESDENLIYYYNKHNESVFVHGLKTGKYEIVEFIRQGLSIGVNEDIEDLYDNVAKKLELAKQIRDKNMESAIDLPNTHLLSLQTKSKLMNHDKNKMRIFTSKLYEALETIDKIEYCSKILKIAANWNQLVIYFDCSREHTKFMDPSSSVQAQAKIFKSGKAFVAAKKLFDNDEKFSIFGAIIHELCHCAVNVIYGNNFNPYAVGESGDKLRFEEKVMEECKRNQKLDWHVENVLGYDKEHQSSEFIVTYPQAIMEYYKKSDEMRNFAENFKELVSYSREVIEPEMQSGLNVRKMLQDNSRRITFAALTRPLQTKLLNSVVHYKVSDVILKSLYDKNPDIVDQITSDAIKDFLLTAKKIEISNVSWIDRELKLNETSTTTYSHFSNTSVIICSFSGSGMSTFLKSTAQKLKEDNDGLIVTYLDLKIYENFFDTFINQPMDVSQVLKLFGNKNLSSDVRAIYLLDNLDRIWTKYGKMWLDVFKIVKNETKIDLWISSTPRQTPQLEEIFDIQHVKFAPLTDVQVAKFIKIHLRNSIKYDVTISENILKFLKFLDNPGPLEPERCNLVLIQKLLSLHTENKLDLDPSNLFNIFSKIYKSFCCNSGVHMCVYRTIPK